MALLEPAEFEQVDDVPLPGTEPEFSRDQMAAMGGLGFVCGAMVTVILGFVLWGVWGWLTVLHG